MVFFIFALELSGPTSARRMSVGNSEQAHESARAHTDHQPAWRSQ